MGHFESCYHKAIMQYSSMGDLAALEQQKVKSEPSNKGATISALDPKVIEKVRFLDKHPP